MLVCNGEFPLLKVARRKRANCCKSGGLRLFVSTDKSQPHSTDLNSPAVMAFYISLLRNMFKNFCCSSPLPSTLPDSSSWFPLTNVISRKTRPMLHGFSQWNEMFPFVLLFVQHLMIYKHMLRSYGGKSGDQVVSILYFLALTLLSLRTYL